MKKSIALGITLTGIGAALFGAFSLYKLTKEEQADTDIDINIGNDIDVDTDEDIGSGNKIGIKVLEPDVTSVVSDSQEVKVANKELLEANDMDLTDDFLFM